MLTCKHILLPLESSIYILYMFWLSFIFWGLFQARFGLLIGK